jgi:UDP-N-acetyl-D-galactosamine dehydrogenase
MGAYVATEVVKLMVKAGKPVKNAKALMLGITFKENCPDIRNTRAIDVYHELKDFAMEVDVYDPWASHAEVLDEYGIEMIEEIKDFDHYGCVILAVAHNEFKELDYKRFKDSGAIIYDVKSILPRDIIDARL